VSFPLPWFCLFAFLASVVPSWGDHPNVPKPLRLVVWNVQNYVVEQDAREGLAAKPENQRQKIAAILRDLRPDVIGLVEVGGSASLLDLQERLSMERASFPYHVLVKGPDEGRYLALLSKFPLREDWSKPRIPFTLHGTPQVMRRGILDVLLEWPGVGDIRLVGVHLKSRREVPAFNQEEFRTEEFQLLRQHLDEGRKNAPQIPIIVWGDFNTYKNEIPFRDFLGARGHANSLHPLDLQDSFGLAWTHYWAAADLYSRIDFLLLSTHWTGLLASRSSGYLGPEEITDLPSDHRYLFYEFIIK
jgi:endonuclease/exonuclease/phosphatase family metal-dependent hydrolase